VNAQERSGLSNCQRVTRFHAAFHVDAPSRASRSIWPKTLTNPKKPIQKPNLSEVVYEKDSLCALPWGPVDF
jgi:hypothetical protein